MRQAERNHVFNNCQARIKKATLDYLQIHGYYITNIEDMKNLDDSILGSILPSVNEYTKYVKVVSDGIHVTDSRLEKMLNCIYTIEDIVSKEKNNERNIQPLIKELSEIKDSSPTFLILIAFVTLPLLPISICLFILIYLKYKKRNEMIEKIKEEIKHKATMIISEL